VIHRRSAQKNLPSQRRQPASGDLTALRCPVRGLIQFRHSSCKNAPVRSVCLSVEPPLTNQQMDRGRVGRILHEHLIQCALQQLPDHSTPGCRSDLSRCPTTAPLGSTPDCTAAALKPSPSLAATHAPRASENRLRPRSRCDTPPHHWPQFA
jgi:hypothetical protein